MIKTCLQLWVRHTVEEFGEEKKKSCYVILGWDAKIFSFTVITARNQGHFPRNVCFMDFLLQLACWMHSALLQISAPAHCWFYPMVIRTEGRAAWAGGEVRLSSAKSSADLHFLGWWSHWDKLMDCRAALLPVFPTGDNTGPSAVTFLSLPTRTAPLPPLNHHLHDV